MPSIIEELGAKLCLVTFLTGIFFPPKCLNFSIWFWMKYRSIAWLLKFADVYCLSMKRGKRIYCRLEGSVQITKNLDFLHYFPKCSCGASVKCFPTGEIRTEKSRLESYAGSVFFFFFFYLNTLCFIVTISFSQQQTASQHLKRTSEKKKNFAWSKKVT